MQQQQVLARVIPHVGGDRTHLVPARWPTTFVGEVSEALGALDVRLMERRWIGGAQRAPYLTDAGRRVVELVKPPSGFVFGPVCSSLAGRKGWEL